jgi:predicted glycoside hydrolase/deacetylase ChbG (UPF0249 family)
MKNTSMDMADRNGSALRRLLFSADRLRERAIRLGLDQVKTPRSRSSASLSRITRPDQRPVDEAFLQDRRLLWCTALLGITRDLESSLLITSMRLHGVSSSKIGFVMNDMPSGSAVVRPIVLCADDYGLSSSVSRGIRQLIEQGRLSATSCMVVFPEFETEGPLLKRYADGTDIGLHFTLTHKRPLKSLMRLAYLRRLDEAEISQELERQLATFARVMDRPPDYIDGHQHVHLLPGIREAVVTAAQRLNAYVRSTREPIDASMVLRPSFFESAFLSWAARPLQQLTRSRSVRTNLGFRGVRGFRERVPYRALFRKMVARSRSGSIVMCHPGIADSVSAERDWVTTAREDELRYFSSEHFLQDLTAENLKVSRLDDALRGKC